MVGFIFALSLLSILTTVGFLFAWMVRMASHPEQQDQQYGSAISSELVKDPLSVKKP